MVKLSSRHRTSGAFEPGGKEGERGECEGVCTAEATMLHSGQPGFGAKDMLGSWSCADQGMLQRPFGGAMGRQWPGTKQDGYESRVSGS